MIIRPVGPDAGPLAPLLNDLSDAVRELLNPTFPHPVFATASTMLPPAADYPSAVVRATDLNILVVSDGASRIRQDTGAAI